jgi:hypothetical protein
MLPAPAAPAPTDPPKEQLQKTPVPASVKLAIYNAYQPLGYYPVNPMLLYGYDPSYLGYLYYPTYPVYFGQ